MALAIVSVLYTPVLRAGYAWDDWLLFVNRSVLRNVDGWQDLLAAISKPILPGTTYFRPLVLLSFVIEFKIFGLMAKISHAINFLIFIINGALVFLLVERFCRVIRGVRGKEARVGAVSSLFYFLHPAQIESVAWISGRFDLLVTTFCLLVFCSDLFLDGWRRHVLTTVFFVGAALSKEMALTMPVLMVLLYLAYSDTGKSSFPEVVQTVFKRYLWVFLWMACAGGICLYLRYLAFGKLMQSGEQAGETMDLLSHVGFVGQTILFYAQMLFWPFSDLGPQHPFHVKEMGAAIEWRGFAVVVSLVLYFIYALWRRNQGHLLLLALMISFFPVLNILRLTIGVNIGHERFMALPLAVASVVLAQLIGRLFSGERSQRIYISAVSAVWFGVAAINVYVTVPLWRNDVTLWSWAYSKAPLEPYTQLSLIGALYRDRDIDAAERIIGESVEGGADPKRFDVIRAAIKVEKGDFTSGVELVDSVLNRKGRPDQALINAGVDMHNVRVNVDKSPEAASYAFAYITLARAYIGLYDFKRAEHAARLANFYNSDYPIGRLMLALALYGQNQWGQGEQEFNAARRMFHPAAQQDLEATRSYFFRRICSDSERQYERPEAVCAAGERAK